MGTLFYIGVRVTVCALVLSTPVSAEGWRWPEQDHKAASSVRIDTKVAILGDIHRDQRGDTTVHTSTVISHKKGDDGHLVPFSQPIDTEGFYNRPPGAGRYPVQSQTHNAPYAVDKRRAYQMYNEQSHDHRSSSDGTLDSFQYCKCTSTPDCNRHIDSKNACGAGKYLCCYNKPKETSELYNEVNNQQQMLYPVDQDRILIGPSAVTGQVRPPSYQGGASHTTLPVLSGPGGPTGSVGPAKARPVLVGPGGPTGKIGPEREGRREVLVGPGGPTGVVGPKRDGQRVLVGPGGPTGQIGPDREGRREVLVGPGGPTGVVGPEREGEREVLVGPSGPTGIIGPAATDRLEVKGDSGLGETAQRPVLVGPGGPTGIIGPYNNYRGQGQRPVLVGPGGPTGVIGPGFGAQRGVLTGPGGGSGRFGPSYYGRQGRRGVLVGPGGPTGTIGPGRQLLVGPGGPTGIIGPQRYYRNYDY